MKDLASHIMDIVQNSVRAQASKIEIIVCEDYEKDIFIIEIRDNGCGMDEATLKRVRDPFFTSRTVRKVGLGIPLLQQNAERTGGKVDITSEVGKGTNITAYFRHSNVDRPPLGDIAETLGLLTAANPDIHFIYNHTTNQGQYSFDTEEIKEVLDGISPAHPDILPALQDMIRENLKEIKAGQSSLFLKNNKQNKI